jgi:hypothetical protein
MNIKVDLLNGKGCANLLKSAGNHRNRLKLHTKFSYLENISTLREIYLEFELDKKYPV